MSEFCFVSYQIDRHLDWEDDWNHLCNWIEEWADEYYEENIKPVFAQIDENGVLPEDCAFFPDEFVCGDQLPGFDSIFDMDKYKEGEYVLKEGVTKETASDILWGNEKFQKYLFDEGRVEYKKYIERRMEP